MINGGAQNVFMRQGASMQACPNCGRQNRSGIVFCENCGASLIGDAPLSTKTLTGSRLPDHMTSAIASSGSEVLQAGMVLRLEIDGAEPLLLKPKREIIFGRRDPSTGSMPDVDLTPFAGYRLGVSRKHATLRQNEGDRLDLYDLGSSNGTYLNGVKLAAHRPNRVHDGDEIRLGQMVLHIYFQPVAAQNESSENTGKTDNHA